MAVEAAGEVQLEEDQLDLGRRGTGQAHEFVDGYGQSKKGRAGWVDWKIDDVR